MPRFEALRCKVRGALTLVGLELPYRITHSRGIDFLLKVTFGDAVMSAHTRSVDDKKFESDVLKAEGPVLVDFWAEWCGPCKMIAPALEEIASEYGGKLTVAKLNIDDNPEAPTRFGVRSIPTLILFNKGEVVGQKTGALPKSQLKAWVESLL